MKPWSLLVLAMLLATPGCYTTGESAGTAHVNQNLLSAEEMDRYDLPNLFDLVRTARPFWLQKRVPHTLRGPGNEGEVWVYMDETRVGGPEVLRVMALTSVTRLEYLPPAAANRRYGRGHQHGAILLHQDF
jgi:hypothetical protein